MSSHTDLDDMQTIRRWWETYQQRCDNLVRVLYGRALFEQARVIVDVGQKPVDVSEKMLVWR